MCAGLALATAPAALAGDGSKSSQMITFSKPADGVVGDVIALQASASSGLPVVFTSKDPSVCSVSGDRVTLIKRDSCTIYADQPGDAQYEPANQVNQSISPSRAPRSLSLSVTPSSLAPGGVATLSATPSVGAGSIDYTRRSGPCSLSGAVLTATGVGTCVVEAEIGNDDNYLAATSPSVSVTIAALSAASAATRSVSIAASPAALAYGESASLSASVSAGSGVVSYALVSGPCALSGAVLQSTGVGDCIVQASVAADGVYGAATSSALVVAVDRASRSLSLSASPSNLVFGAFTTLTATASAGTGAITYVLVSGPCALSGASLVATGVGDCVLQASVAADAHYLAVKSATIVVSAGRSSRSISLSASAASLVVGGGATLSATVSAGTGAVTYSLVSGPCIVSGASLSATGVGVCVAQASVAADGRYASATSSTLSLAVGRASSSVSLSASTLSPVAGSSVTLVAQIAPSSATGSVTFRDGGVALGTIAVSGGAARFATGALTAGVHHFTADYAGDSAVAGASSGVLTVEASRRDAATRRDVRDAAAHAPRAIQQSARLHADAISQRLERLHGDAPGSSILSPRPLASQPDLFVWMTGALQDDATRGDAVTQKARQRSVAAGVDGALTPDWKIGLSVGVATHRETFGAGGGGASRVLSLAFYQSWRAWDSIYLDAYAGGGASSSRLSRSDDEGGTSGARRGRFAMAGASLIWERGGGAFKHAPYARYEITRAWLDAYAESGAPDGALIFAPASATQQAATIGWRAQYDLAFAGGVIAPTMRIEMRRIFASRLAQHVAYLAAPEVDSAIVLSNATQDAATGALGLRGVSGPFEGHVEYVVSQSLRGGARGQGVRGHIRMRF